MVIFKIRIAAVVFFQSIHLTSASASGSPWWLFSVVLKKSESDLRSFGSQLNMVPV